MTSSTNNGSQDPKALSVLAMASHEVRGALAAIISHAELLAERAESPHESRATALLIERHGRAVLATFDAILKSAQHHGERAQITTESCDLRAMIHELVLLQTPRARSAGLFLEATVDDSMPLRVEIDGDSVHRILSNLIENAMKYTIDGGVRIRALVAASGAITIEVEDTGLGIEASDAERIFDPYVQADHSRRSSISGVGLGLALCRELAHAIDAELAFESGSDGGSVFRLTFADRSSDSPSIEKVFEGVRILLIDDCDETLRMHSAMLEARGALVTTTSETRTLVPRYFGGADAPFDVILVDLEMPTLDGWAVRKLLRLDGCRIPVVAVTAHEIDPLRSRAFQHDFSGLLSKPLDLNRLAALIHRGVSQRPSRLAG